MKPLSDEWTSYSGDLTGKRYSALKLVNKDTVKNLSLKWITPLTQGCGPTGTRGPAGLAWRLAAEAAVADVAVAAAGSLSDRRRRARQRRREHVRPGTHRRRHPGGRRTALRGVAQQRLRRRRTRRRGALAQLLEVARRHDHRHARAGHARQPDLLLAARRLGRRARCEDRQGSLAARGRAVRPAVLLVDRADADQRATCSSAPATTSTRPRS